jgi:LmbE family N-acetylglucosaminyl deacetylase
MHDQLKMQQGLGALSGQLDTIRKNVIKLITELKPDVVLTWGPAGWTGHHDHRLVGSVVTEVFASQAWPKPMHLYYAELPAGSLPKESSFPVATVDPRYLTIKVPLTDKDYDKAKAAWLCHKSQYTAETVEQLHQLVRTTQKGIAYFRPFELTGSQSFFP